jgi:hypothetical protein
LSIGLLSKSVLYIATSVPIIDITYYHPPLHPLPSREGGIKEVPSPLEGEGKGEG